MPPKGKPLSAEEITLLTRWISEGAQWPDDGWRPPAHWSYLAPKKVEVPQTGAYILNGRQANEVDHFIAAKLSANGLSLNPEAEPDRLLRLAYLDLIGLPPTIDEIDSFLKDPTFDHYVRIIDRLLASPRFGEKWAVPWLDMARYADSEGYQRDSPPQHVALARLGDSGPQRGHAL